MRISVFGLGYVGAVCSGCLASMGHAITGVDVSRPKVDLINSGNSPIVEKDLDGYIKNATALGALRATTDAVQAIAESEMSFICVGTPSRPDGAPNLEHVEKVCADIGRGIRNKDDFHIVVIRSTVLPGTTKEIIIPSLEAASGGTAGRDFGVASNPEFLRESTAIFDFFNPPKTVVGEYDRRSADAVASLYGGIRAPLLRVSIDAAEMVKFADNAWHAAKVVFANEIGNICKKIGVDGHEVMEVFCSDRKLNISPAYLRPGFAFGGSCLPKDVRALCYKAKSLNLTSPLLESLMISNQFQIERALTMIRAHPGRNVGLLGLSFKAGTDDLRESPLVALAERLIGEGYDLRIFDRNVSIPSLNGANRDYVLSKIPNVARLLMTSLNEVIGHCDTLIVGNAAPEFSGVVDRMRANQVLIDLVRISARTSDARYEGICW